MNVRQPLKICDKKQKKLKEKSYKLTSSRISKCRSRPTVRGWRLSSTLNAVSEVVVAELAEPAAGTATTLKGVQRSGSKSASSASGWAELLVRLLGGLEAKADDLLLMLLMFRTFEFEDVEPPPPTSRSQSSNSSLEAMAQPPVMWLPTMVSGSTPSLRSAPSSLSYSSRNFLEENTFVNFYKKKLKPIYKNLRTVSGNIGLFLKLNRILRDDVLTKISYFLVISFYEAI